MIKQTPEQKLKHLDKLKGSEERNNFETLWQAGADFCNPENSDIRRDSGKGERRNLRRITDVGIEARRRFATGMFSYAIGTGKFFTFRTDDKELMDNEEVGRWFNDVDRVTMSELKESNFDAEVLQGFGELSYIGTTNTFSEWYDGRLNFKTQHISQYWIDVDARGRVDYVFVEFEFNAKQMITEFGEDNVPDFITEAYNSSSTEEFVVVQCCGKNHDYKEDSINPLHREFVSEYIMRKGNEVIRTDGYDTFPFSVARLYKARNEVYGRSCYMECSKTISLHNDERITLIRGAKNRADPPWVEAADSRTRHMRNNEVSKVIYDPTSLGGAPVQMDMKNDVGITIEMLKMDEETIFKAFYIPAFNPLLDQQNMTATETMQRIDIGLAEVSPPLAKWQAEYATPLLERVFDILNRKDRYPKMPDILEGRKFKIDYVSKASLALKQLEVYGAMDSWEKATIVGQFRPEILDNFNVDELANLFMESNNVSNAIDMTTDDVAVIRKIRSDKAEKQQQVENMPVVADAALKASQVEVE